MSPKKIHRKLKKTARMEFGAITRLHPSGWDNLDPLEEWEEEMRKLKKRKKK